MPLITALGLLLAVPALVVFVQEEKDATMRGLGIMTILCGAFFALHPYIHLLRDIAPSYHTVFVIIGVLSAVLGLLVVLRCKNQVVGTLCCSSGCLLALIALRAIDT